MAENIFNMKSADLVNLKKFMKRAPKLFTRAAVGVVNDLLFQARKEAIQNIKSRNISRTPKFVDASMRVNKAKFGTSLSQVMGSMGSIDVSGKGLSTGFAEQEDGTISSKTRIQTLLSRVSGNKSKKVSKIVRMNRASVFHNKKKFKGGPAHMLRALRSKQIPRKPVLIDQQNNVGMIPGVYRMKGKDLQLVQVFRARKRKVQAIHWMRDASRSVTEQGALTKTWVKHVNRVLPRTLK